ncbi:hypothetical protein BIW11_03854 [Tropilaelaps mercedesae]|uniref:PDZ domain-containing protein n=1 Tax=Tropilaelaps mercedesae TaxID=418985 RepID=A0A1V9XER5_9ACAR|nr:hypothetical protein BIW11_03854 [Tropilaelaps mercedesae]
MELYSDGPPRSRIKRMFGSLCNWPSLPEERSCACGCFNSIIEIMQELRTAAFEHAVIEALKSELRNRLSVYSWINKQFFTPEDAKIQSWILSWIIDFAIICDLRSKTLQPLYSMKDVFRPRLVSVEEENTNLALGAQGSRVIVSAVIPSSDADRAKVLENDVILEINGAVIGAPCDIIANAGSKRFQYIRTDARQESGEINTTFRVTLQPDRRYINFGLWAASKSQPELLGYGSMHLYACLAHCLEAEGPTIISLPLGHPDRMTSKLVPRTLQKHIRALGFNSRLCHGNIELRMTVIR